MKALTVDDQKRIRIPDAKPRQVFAYENNGITKEINRELAALAKGSSLHLPD